jgi:phospholipase/carboxylesterase
MIYEPTALVEEGVYRSQLDEAGRMPVALCLPQAYEPRYPYPLLVFLHGDGESETQWTDAVPALSRRNYIGISLRGPRPVVRPDGALGFSWGRTRRCDGALEDYVVTAVTETMRVCHVHSERIFLAGFCEGASIAYQLGLTFPDRFAGVVALNGWLPRGPLPPADERCRRSLAVFIGHGREDAVVPMARAIDAYRTLHAAGVDVRMRLYATSHLLLPEMLRDIDHWVIDHCRGQGRWE